MEAEVEVAEGMLGFSHIYTEAGVKSQFSSKIDERWEQIQASMSTGRSVNVPA